MEEEPRALEFFFVALDYFSWHTLSTCKISIRRLALKGMPSLSQDELSRKLSLLHTGVKEQHRELE